MTSMVGCLPQQLTEGFALLHFTLSPNLFSNLRFSRLLNTFNFYNGLATAELSIVACAWRAWL